MRTWAWLMVAACSAPTPAFKSDPVRLAERDRQDVAAMRDHMWHVWAGVQKPPSWWTWERSDPVLGNHDRVFRSLQPFRSGDRVEQETLAVAFDVRFDQAAAAHVRDHELGRRAHQRPFPEFPAGAVALKAVWFAIKQHGLTAMPVWDGEPANPDALGNPDRTWNRVVAVDPSGARADDTTSIELAGRTFTARVVALSRLFHLTLDTTTVAAARAATHDDTLVAGDYVALVAMHVTAKEIAEWTWATLWWHDLPDDGPYAAGRPASVTGVFRDYLMDVTYSAITPAEADGSPRACMNPWLEARFPDGLHSNCVACHQRAVVGAIDYLPVTRGSLVPGELGDQVQTDFVWSLALEAR
jgi:hypothetical protein